MPYIQVDGTQHSLRVGETPVGTSPDAGIRVAGPDALGVQAVLTVASDRSVSIRRATPASVVKVNGVQLGAEPSPLIHGDKIEVAGREMLFGDEKKSGGTQMLSGMAIPDLEGGLGAAPARPTAATGGRLVSLVDGREYAVPAEGLTLGREAGCDVVVPGSDVSRRHADIVAGESGYVITDSSTNGVFVNGERIRKTQLLGRGDVVRIGQEEFRFYADVPAPVMPTLAIEDEAEEAAAPGAAPSAGSASPPSAPPIAARPATPASAPPATPPSAASATPGSAPLGTPGSAPHATPASTPAAARPPSPSAPPAARPPSPPAPPGAQASPPRPAGAGGARGAGAPGGGTPAAAAPAPGGAATPQGVPATPADATAARPVLATLEVTNEVVHKGRRFEVRLPLVHVGRGSHNDISLPDDSVSDTHAKLQKRDDGWYVVDMGSTNGTYVAGRRIGSEQRLDSECDLRFGGIRMRFRAAADAVDESRGTRAIAGVNVAEARRAAAAAREPAPDLAKEKRRAVPAYVWILALLLLGLAVFFILQGQAR